MWVLGGVKNLSVGICDGAPLTARSSFTFYPHAFFKKRKGDIVIASVVLSVCQFVRLSIMLSPPKPLDEIQPNLVCELLT